MSLVLPTVGKVATTRADVIDAFVREEGRLNMGWIRDNVDQSSPWLNLFNNTVSRDDNQSIKRLWPHGMGSTFTTTVMTEIKAEPSVGEGWESYANNACAWTCHVIDYGTKQITGCLEKYCVRTPDFCIPDLQWDTQVAAQISHYRGILSNYSNEIWHYWLQASYVKNSRNVVLNQGFGYPNDIGAFPPYGPSSYLTFEHFRRLTKDLLLRQGRAGQSPALMVGNVPKFVVLISEDMYDFLKQSYIQYHNTTYGFRPNAIGQIEAQEFGGELESFSNWIFINLEYPRRYIWNDMLNIYHDGEGNQRPIPPWIKVRATRGWESKDNSVYDHGTGKAHETLVEEVYVWNSAAMHWLIPSEFTAMGVNVDPANYMGTFKLFNQKTEADPDAEAAHMYARYVAGAMPHRPERGMTIRALVPRRGAVDLTPEASFPKPIQHKFVYPILEVHPRLESGQIHIVTTAQLPVQCPMGSRLVIRTQSHGEAEITAVTGGTQRLKEMLPVRDYVLTLSPSNLAAVRMCDPWVAVLCKPESEPCQPIANDADCPTCTAGHCETKCYRVTLSGASLTGLTDEDENDVLFFSPLPATLSNSTTLAAVQLALNAYIAGNGSAEITYNADDTEFTVTIYDTTQDMTQFAVNGTTFEEIDCPE